MRLICLVGWLAVLFLVGCDLKAVGGRLVGGLGLVRFGLVG